ncbi:MAG: NUDIX hydrolase [Myxococcales bacterium]|nr:NUDIX hydrolase [Myxococcales bacterium]
MWRPPQLQHTSRDFGKGELVTVTKENGPRELRIPDGDDRERLLCPDCGYIAYENPKIVVGAVVEHEAQILLCKRAIEPRVGYWTLPAGFLEMGESPEDGTRREAWEEARARLELTGLLAVYSLARISQVQLIYRASLADPSFAPGPESQEVALFPWDSLPWDALAFPTVTWALERYKEVQFLSELVPATNPVGRPIRWAE